MVDHGRDQAALPRRASLWPAEGPPVPARVLASWQRSEEYGVGLEEVDPFFVGTDEQESLFLRCGTEVLTALHSTLLGEPVSLMLADNEGRVLSRLSGDTGLLRALDAVHLAPGFAFSEREVGTNGLGLALADGLPALVHAEEHYSMTLCGYTCAAVPVTNPVDGRLEGSVNLTTWSRSSSGLLLALAQSAAANTSALMLSRTHGHSARPAPRGEVFLVERGLVAGRSVSGLSSAWTDALDQAAESLTRGHVLAAVGEPGSGRATLVAQAMRRAHRRDRILSARPPAPCDVDAWLSLWHTELGKPHTSVIVTDVDTLTPGTTRRLRQIVDRVRPAGARPGLSLALTAGAIAGLPDPITTLVERVVEVPTLRERPDDIRPLAEHAARQLRGRDVTFTPAALRALRDAPWPGNVDELFRTVRAAAQRTDTIDLQHLPVELLSRPGHRLTRLQTLERDEILRAMARPGATTEAAARELGMSRATIYRKIRQYGLRLPGRAPRGTS